MTRAITDQEQTYFRTKNQRTRLKVYFRHPTTIYTARLGSVPSSTDMVYQITYTNGAGTLGDVKVNMVMYVGTTPGAKDLGLARIRKVPDVSMFYIGEQSEIDWQSQCYLTIVDDTFGIWPKHLRIVSQVPYMDTDVTYSDQHTDFDPVPIMGSDRVVNVEDGEVETEWDGSDSWVLGSTITGYSWSAPGASSTSGLATATPTIGYDAEGEYMVYLTVTAANGKTATGSRVVFADGGTLGVEDAEIEGIMGAILDGGWQFDVTLRDTDDVIPYSKCILAAEDWYGETQINIGPLAGAENIVVNGWVAEEALSIDLEKGTTKFRIKGAQHQLKNIPGFTTGIESTTATASAWTNIKNLTVDKGLFHLLHWRTTALHVMDFFKTSDTLYVYELSAVEGSLWSQLEAFAAQTILANVFVNSFGQLFVFKEPQLVPETDRSAFTTVRTISDAAGDIQRPVELEYLDINQVARVNFSGVNIDVANNPYSIFSLAPGHVFKRTGATATELLSNLLVGTQAQTNSIAGLLLAWRNNKYGDIILKLVANDRMEDMAPAQYIAATITDSVRGIALDGNFIPRQIEYKFDKAKGKMTTEFVLEFENTEDLSVDGDVPNGTDAPIGLPNLPPLPPMPDIPEIITIPGVPDEDPTPKKVLFVGYLKGLVYTENFNETVSGQKPTWEFKNVGLDESRYSDIDMIEVTPSGAIYILIRALEEIWYAPYIGAAFTKVIDQDWIDTNVTAYTPTGITIGADRTNWNRIGVMVGWQTSGSTAFNQMKSFIITSGVAGSVSSQFDGAGYGNIWYANGNWFYIGLKKNIFWVCKWWKFNSTFSSIVTEADFPAGAGAGLPYGRQTGASSDALMFWGTSILKSTAGAAPIHVSTGQFDNLLSYNSSVFGVDPSGLYLRGYQRKKSSDGGSTTSAINVLYPVSGVEYKWWNCGDSSRWVCGASGIYYTPDNGVSVENKDGNILSLLPTGPGVKHIRVLP